MALVLALLLAEIKIPRSTADRLVERHAETLGITENVPSEAINPQVEVEKLIKATVPRLRRVLSTPQMAYQYVAGMIKEFDLSCEAASCWRSQVQNRKPLLKPSRVLIAMVRRRTSMRYRANLDLKLGK